MNPKSFFKLGMHPLAPRWFKIWCLKMILNRVGKEMKKAVDRMTPEQRKAFDESVSSIMAKHGKMRA